MVFSGDIDLSLVTGLVSVLSANRVGRGGWKRGPWKLFLSFFLLVAYLSGLHCNRVPVVLTWPCFFPSLCCYAPPCSTHRTQIPAEIQFLSHVLSHLAFTGTRFTDFSEAKGSTTFKAPPTELVETSLRVPPNSESQCLLLHPAAATVPTGKLFLPRNGKTCWEPPCCRGCVLHTVHVSRTLDRTQKRSWTVPDHTTAMEASGVPAINPVLNVYTSVSFSHHSLDCN